MACKEEAWKTYIRMENTHPHAHEWLTADASSQKPLGFAVCLMVPAALVLSKSAPPKSCFSNRFKH